ncbi:MAG: GGDEF domain-containing protein [bacterium]
MRITELEIQRRKELLGLTRADLTLLTEVRGIVEENLDAIVDDFYERQTANAEIALLIGDADTLMRLKAAQRNYILELFGGYYDSEYVNSRLRIGMVHKRIGVGPKHFTSAVLLLKQIMLRVIGIALQDEERTEAIRQALEKLIQFDTAFVFDTYIKCLVSEIELSREKVESYARDLEATVRSRTRELEELSQRDSLTSLYNRRALLEMLRRDLGNARRSGDCVSMVYLDVDRFKQINDNEGHHRGDEVLKSVASVLSMITRDVDIAGRFGGDEFCIVLPGTDQAGARVFAERLIRELGERQPEITLSIGICQNGPHEFIGIPEMLRCADERMYLSKKQEGSFVSC